MAASVETHGRSTVPKSVRANAFSSESHKSRLQYTTRSEFKLQFLNRDLDPISQISVKNMKRKSSERAYSQRSAKNRIAYLEPKSDMYKEMEEYMAKKMPEEKP